jgi:hypothetical protein
MNDTHNQKPSCFGALDIVFPRGDDGLRHPPESCLSCDFKTECLLSAMKHENGLNVQEELLDRAYQSKKISFFERWSRKKYLQGRREKLKK